MGSLAVSLPKLLAGYMIQQAGCESMFRMIDTLHSISALLLKSFVPKIALVTE